MAIKCPDCTFPLDRDRRYPYHYGVLIDGDNNVQGEYKIGRSHCPACLLIVFPLYTRIHLTGQAGFKFTYFSTEELYDKSLETGRELKKILREVEQHRQK